MIRRPWLALFLSFAFVPQLHAQTKQPPWQPLWTEAAPGAKGKEPGDVPAILVSRAPADKANGTAIVVCPGGGYGGLAMDHEGHQIAQWLNNHGVTAIILKYRLGPRYHHPIPLTDAQRAIRVVRTHADVWAIDKHRIGILGFSAGGHLASTAGTHFDDGDAKADDPIDRITSRPDFMVLLYPVITLTGPAAHVGSRNNLLGKNPDPKLVESLCNHNMVTQDTPPTFLVHTTEDKAVPPENSVLFYSACVKHKVPAELHIYERGRHGLGLGPKELPFSSWPDRCLAWLQSRGLLERSAR